ncbi:hypothetical protein AB0M36_23220 [Actinoplanes sp. NPDC051346]|uniref:hypothetical protein n=1 Tax=Actinoplanes sp. NPDC051346 TaxID=3155048 RepID=UPI0034190D47
MPSIVFVHGIGVRDDEYRAVWPHLSGRLGELFPGTPATFCFWGGEHGARLDDDVPPAPDPRAELWAASLADPWWELATLAEKAAQEPARPRPVHLPPAGPALRARLLALAAAPGIAGPDLGPHLAAAVEELLAATVVRECLSRAEAIGAELPSALARALVVLAVARAGTAGPAVLAPGTLDVAEAALVTALGGQPMAVPGWMRRLAGRLIRPHLEAGLRPLSWALAAAREPLTRGVTPYLGDIMVYLARGERIRDAIAAGIAERPEPVDVIAHSLGGIACFDLLVRGRLPGVRSLVTVGSQISYLYGIDALPALRRGTPPPPLPTWVNVYDRHDALGFPARPAFPQADDRRLDSGLPFPLAHSAYFRNPAFYALLEEVIG